MYRCVQFATDRSDARRLTRQGWKSFSSKLKTVVTNYDHARYPEYGEPIRFVVLILLYPTAGGATFLLPTCQFFWLYLTQSLFVPIVIFQDGSDLSAFTCLTGRHETNHHRNMFLYAGSRNYDPPFMGAISQGQKLFSQ